MALFRKFFYRKPPDGLLEITERVFVFDCCFTTDVFEDNEYKVYMGSIVGQLHEYFPDASYVVFNFREGEYQNQISNILSEFDMTVMDYPQQYVGCPLLTLETVNHFLRSSESWLSLGQRNVLLVHCEPGRWPVLAFMLAALLIYRKQYTGEQKTLEMIYKQAPFELLQLISPLNPLPSQLRYLQYVSRRNVGSVWPPLDRALTLDCIILRVIPNMDGEGGCRPIFRIYGQDPFMAADRTPKVLFSTPKMSKIVRHYKQADCELVKIDIHCHIIGDVVLECISVDDDLKREEMLFRVMFNTAFIRSNILILNRDEIDILWNRKDQFPKDFRAEVLFSEMDSASSLITFDLPGIEEKEGLPVEAFAKVQEIFSIVDWLDPKADVVLKRIQQITASNILQDKLESGSPRNPEREKKDSSCFETQSAEKEKLESGCFETPSAEKVNLESAYIESCNEEKLESVSPKGAKKEKMERCSPQTDKKDSFPQQAIGEQSLLTKKIETQELQVTVQRYAQSKIISQRIPQSTLSNPASYCNSLQSSPVPISRYNSAPSALGITALLHDHAESKNKEASRPVTVSASSAVSAPFPRVCKTVQPSTVPVPTPSQPPASLKVSMAITEMKTSATSIPPPPPPLPPPPHHHQHSASVSSHSLLNDKPETSLQHRGQLSSVCPPPVPSASFSLASQSPSHMNSFSTPDPSPPPFLEVAPFPTARNSISTSPPPPPPPPPSISRVVLSSTIKNSSSIPPPPPPPPGIASSPTFPMSTLVPKKNSAVVPPPPPPLHSEPVRSPTITFSVPPPPPPPRLSPKNPMSKSSPHVPTVPPPPAPFVNGSSKPNGASSQSQSASSNGNIPPVPPPFSAKGRLQPRTSTRNQAQSAKKTTLKPYHWLKLTRAMQGSLWAEAQKADESSKAPEFDMSELERLFSANVPNSDHESTGRKLIRRSSGLKSDKVNLIDLRRAYNCEIMLTKVKVPLPDLMSLVLALDESALDVDQVDNLIKFCPTKEEMELLKNYNGDKENLGKCEQFFLELMKVPRVESKLRVFSFKIQFHSQIYDLRNSLNIVNSTSEEIRNSVKLKRIMQTILSLGNALNHGTARGSAVGFRLDSLLKLTDTRARNNKLTLMHYLCKVLAEKLPELLHFPKDLVSLEASTKIQLKYLAEEMQALSKGLEKVIQELTASENDGPVSEFFCKTLKEFLGFAEAEVRSLALLYSGVGRNADALALYFGEDPARCPFEQVVSTLLNFVRMFVRAHNENCKQLEFEKKKAQKEAENEKSKLSASKKVSENEKMRTTPPNKASKHLIHSQ